MIKILILCTYPIKAPRHGGQLRVRNIVDAYLSQGYHVEVAGVLGSEHYESEDGFLPFPKASTLINQIAKPFLMEDYAIARTFADETIHYQKLAATIRSKPDVIHIEQPWLFGFAQRYVSAHQLATKLIYGSQNIEWRLKQEIASSYLDTDTAKHYADLVSTMEMNAIAGADTIACVSESDAQWIKGRTSKPVVLAPNGVKAWHTTTAGDKEASNISQHHRYALYCASAHPPNVTGFFDTFSGGFGSLKPDEKLVVAGGAGWAIAEDLRVHKSAKLAEKVVVAGMVSQPCLEGLLDGAHCIVLPLTQGGGTNLKTAEALWAGKHIVATSIAMRGFERFINSRGVHLADDSVAFKRALRTAMDSEPVKLSTEEIDSRRSVLWDSCLDPLVNQMKILTAEDRS